MTIRKLDASIHPRNFAATRAAIPLPASLETLSTLMLNAEALMRAARTLSALARTPAKANAVTVRHVLREAHARAIDCALAIEVARDLFLVVGTR